MQIAVRLMLAGFCALFAAMPSWAAEEAALARYIEDMVSEQDIRVAKAVARIDSPGRKLLALRYYLRSSAHLAERWSWTEEQIVAYMGSCEHRELQQEVERVQAAFVAANPGYELYVNPAVRSLNSQIDSWNSNESVAMAGSYLLDQVRTLLASPGFPVGDAKRARQALQSFLVGYVPEPTPTLAAPGLSPHGQMRAVDFQVQAEGQIIAAPDISTINTVWEGQGWANKLHAAVSSSTSKLIGPLALPHEPWHYAYAPDAVAGNDSFDRCKREQSSSPTSNARTFAPITRRYPDVLHVTDELLASERPVHLLEKNHERNPGPR
jgi:hypothetical protein